MVPQDWNVALSYRSILYFHNRQTPAYSNTSDRDIAICQSGRAKYPNAEVGSGPAEHDGGGGEWPPARAPQYMCATLVARPGKSRDRSQAAGATEDGFDSITTGGAYRWSGGVSVMAL